jgi:DNA-binding NarL/FixJ family response regulator
MTTRILVADDHEIFVESLALLLSKEPSFEVVGTATDGDQAVRLAREQEPDVVIMDLSMPQISGIEATQLIKTERPAVKVLCLSMHADRGYVMGALDAGASGYLLKDSAKKELINAIRTVMDDQVFLSSAVAGMVVDAARSNSTTPAIELLTERERQILKLLAQGACTKKIADRLHLSVKTVGTHRSHIMEKLDIHSIAGLTKFAVREGLISLDD